MFGIVDDFRGLSVVFLKRGSSTGKLNGATGACARSSSLRLFVTLATLLLAHTVSGTILGNVLNSSTPVPDWHEAAVLKAALRQNVSRTS
jgi:hypothetical protein